MKNSGSIQESTSSTGISVLIVLALGFLMATLDVTVVNVAMADMQNALSMSLSGVTWVVDGYILTFASLLLAGGALADRFGSKTIYILGLAVFVLASCLCAASINGQMLIAGRLIQGIGAALFMPSSLSLLAASYPDERVRARMFGLWPRLFPPLQPLAFYRGRAGRVGGLAEYFSDQCANRGCCAHFSLPNPQPRPGKKQPREHHRASAWHDGSRVSFLCFDTGTFSGLALASDSCSIYCSDFGICAVFAAGNFCESIHPAGVLIQKRPLLSCPIYRVFAEFRPFWRHVYAQPFFAGSRRRKFLYGWSGAAADDGGLRDRQSAVCPSGESV